MDSIKNLCKKYGHVMHLKLFVVNEECRNKYKNSADAHNMKMVKDTFPDAGFDLYTPSNYPCAADVVTKINFEVKCSAKMFHERSDGKIVGSPSGFYMYPRSSISKTPLMLANSVGIIDSGYRGNLIGAFRCFSHGDSYQVNDGDRLVQICAPPLCPIVVEIVDEEEGLGEETSRGEGGFGSTGV